MKYYSPERVEAFLDEIHDVGVSQITLLSCACIPSYDIVQNLALLKAKRDYRKMTVRAFGSFHEVDLYKNIPYEKQTEALLDMGFDGIKFLQMKPNYRKLVGKGINHPDYDKALSILEERGTPVIMHAADPESSWDITKVSPEIVKAGWFYGDGTYPSCKEMYDEVYDMLSKHPRLNLTLAHLFFLSERREDAIRLMETYPNVKLDITPGCEMFVNFSREIEKWREFFITYQDRILFGTDASNSIDFSRELYNLVYTALTHDESIYEMPIWPQDVRGLNLPPNVVDKICYGNLQSFAGQPTTINNELFISAAKRMLEDIKGIESHKASVLWLEEFLGLNS